MHACTHACCTHESNRVINVKLMSVMHCEHTSPFLCVLQLIHFTASIVYCNNAIALAEHLCLLFLLCTVLSAVSFTQNYTLVVVHNYHHHWRPCVDWRGEGQRCIHGRSMHVTGCMAILSGSVVRFGWVVLFIIVALFLPKAGKPDSLVSPVPARPWLQGRVELCCFSYGIHLFPNPS